MPYYDLAKKFTRRAKGLTDPTSAQACLVPLQALLTAYPSTSGDIAVARWTSGLIRYAKDAIWKGGARRGSRIRLLRPLSRAKRGA